ncbi:major facilitator superfamily domain-containing protein [Aspergillus ambiguus]|uniref:putative MFS multidrug transporter n=1 Tax=Aspergillus ambiguus TaxID=176160 RepID=UPI003CCCF784
MVLGDSGKKNPASECSSDVIIVDWTGPDDPENPFNWPKYKKWMVTIIGFFMTFVSLMNGTIITVAHEAINEQFNVSDAQFPHSYWPVTSWAVGGGIFSLIVLPIMEDFGIRYTFLLTHLILIIFVIPQAVAKNFATLIVTRFFAGGCVIILGNSAASIIGNVWQTEKERNKPVTLWIFGYLAGSSIGPVVGASIFQSLSWRWISYMQLIWYGIAFIVNVFALAESRDSVILKQRAKKLRAKGKNAYTNWELQGGSMRELIIVSVRRPLKMFFTEYVVFFSTLWSAFTVGTLYLFTQSVEQVFTGLYGWDSVQAGYVQAAVVIGQAVGCLFSSISERLYFGSAARNKEIPGVPIPESRLYLSIGGGIIGMGGGMFIYAWTSYPDLPWVAPAVGLFMVGMGSVVVVTGLADYIVDAYSKYAGTVMGTVAMGENTLSAFLPLATMSMYQTLGYQWASTLLGFISLLLVVAPISFLIWGKEIRQRSPYIRDALVEKYADVMQNPPV